MATAAADACGNVVMVNDGDPVDGLRGRGGDGHPYAGVWWPDSHILGYEHSFINQAADIVTMLGGGEPVVPMPDFADAYETQRILAAVTASADNRAPVKMDEIK